MPTKTVALGGAGKRASLSRIGQRRQVVIPKEVFERLRLREGDFVEVTVDRGRVSMKPKKLADADDALTASDAKKVRHALKQMGEGKTKSWADLKHELDL